MPALPTFAGTVLPPDLLAKLDAQKVELDAREARLDARAAALESFLRRQSSYGSGPVDGAGAHVYSAKAVPGWTSATRKGGLVLTGTNGGFLDADGRASVAWLADLAGGAKRYVVATWNASGVNGNPGTGAVTATVLDVAADGTVTLVRQSNVQGQGFFPNNNVTLYRSMAQVARVSDTAFKIRAMHLAAASGYYWGHYSLSTYVLNVDNNANTLTVTKEVDLSRNQDSFGALPLPIQAVNTSGFFRRKGWAVGTYSVAFPGYVNSQDAQFVGRPQLSAFLVDRLPGSLPVDGGPVAPSPNAAADIYCMERIGAHAFVTLTDGQSVGRGTPQYSGKVGLAYVDDSHRGSAASVSLPYAIAGTGRLAPVSPDAYVAAYSTAGEYGSFLVTRDPANGRMTWRGLRDAAGIMGQVMAEAMPFSASKLGVWTLGSGWTFNLTTVALDLAAPVGAEATASPFTQVAQVPVALGTAIPGALATDAVVLGAAERIGPDRALIVSRNTNRGGVAIDVVDFA